MWKDRLGKTAEKFRFEKVVAVLHKIIGFESLPPEKMSVRTRALLDAYETEKTKFERIEDFNRNKD